MVVGELYINGVKRNYSTLTISNLHPNPECDIWSATLEKPEADITDQHAVEIKRNGTSIFKGIVEEITPQMGADGITMKVAGRQTKVKVWRKWIERQEGPKVVENVSGFYRDFYPSKAIQWLLRRPVSDDVATGTVHYIGEGMYPDHASRTWSVTASNSEAGHPPSNIKNRYHTSYWSSGVNQANGQWIQIDLGANVSNVCGIKIELRTGYSLDDTDYVRNYEIFADTSNPPVTSRASKSNNAANIIFESWTPATIRYIRITCTGAQANYWAISEVFVYQSEGVISGITISGGNFTEHGVIDEGLDLTYMRLSEKIEHVVKLTETGNVPWEWWVTDDGYPYFAARRGSDLSGSISFSYSSELASDSYKSDSKGRVDRVKVLGTGKGHAQDLITSGWVGSGEYEQIVTDTRLTSVDACTAKANIIIAEEGGGSPKVTIQCVVEDPYTSGSWGVGDDVTLTDAITGLSGAYRVKMVKRIFSSDGEKVMVQASSFFGDVVDFYKKHAKDLAKIHTETVAVGLSSYDREKIDPTKIYPNSGFSKYIEADKASFLGDDTQWVILTGQSHATEGKYIHRDNGDGNSTEGPEAQFNKNDLALGDYYALFRVAVSSNASSSQICTLRVFWDAGGGLYSYALHPDDFPTSGDFHTFAIRFSIKPITEDYIHLDIYNWIDGICDFGVDWFGVVPAGVPFVQTGITIVDADAIDSIDNADAVSSIDTSPSDTVAYSADSTGFVAVPQTTWTNLGNWTPNANHDILFIFGYAETDMPDPITGISVKFRIYDSNDTIYYPNSNGIALYFYADIDHSAMTNFLITIPRNTNGHTLYLQIYLAIARTITAGWTSWGHSPHTHDHTEYSPLRGQTGHTEFSPQHGQDGVTDPEHEH